MQEFLAYTSQNDSYVYIYLSLTKSTNIKSYGIESFLSKAQFAQISCKSLSLLNLFSGVDMLCFQHFRL